MDQTVIVLYPANAEIYPMVVPLKDDYDPINDILQTMKIIGKFRLHLLAGEEIVPLEYSDVLGTFKTGIIKMVKRAVRNQDIQSFRKNVDSYNRGIVRLRENGVFYKSMHYLSPAALPVIEHIMEQSYARIVATQTNELRKYEGIYISKEYNRIFK